MSTQEVVETKRMLVDIENLRKNTPIDFFPIGSADLKDIMTKLERAYDKREKFMILS